MSKTCKFFEDATIFDSDFNETEYKYCTLFGKKRKKIKRTKNCPYRLNLKLSKYKHALEEIRKKVQEDITCESRECGCDSYYECLECLKNTILKIISEVKNAN